MPNRRDLSLKKYNISNYRYRELKNFCLQYDEYKQKQADCYSLHSVSNDGMPHSAAVSNPSENAAIQAAKHSEKIDLIESCAFEASCGSKCLYMALIDNIAHNKSYELLVSVPVGRRQFYEVRHKFFFLLSNKKG